MKRLLRVELMTKRPIVVEGMWPLNREVIEEEQRLFVVVVGTRKGMPMKRMDLAAEAMEIPRRVEREERLDAEVECQRCERWRNDGRKWCEWMC